MGIHGKLIVKNKPVNDGDLMAYLWFKTIVTAMHHRNGSYNHVEAMVLPTCTSKTTYTTTIAQWHIKLCNLILYQQI